VKALALLLALLPGWTRAAAQEPAESALDEGRAREAPTWEGALDNDASVTLAEGARAALRRGDQELALARAAGARPEETERRLDGAFDAWRDALALADAEGVLPHDLESKEAARLGEGVPAAVERRLAALDAAALRRWAERLAPAAEGALAAAGEDEAALLLVRQRFPRTAAGARAALRLGDLALEAGQGSRARALYHLPGGPAEPELQRALAARRAALAPPSPGAEEPWSTATHAVLADVFTWKEHSELPPAPDAGFERSVRPGLAFLSETELCLQTREELLRLALRPDGEVELVERLHPAELVPGIAPLPEYSGSREPPGWPLLPLADGADGVVLVLGRSADGDPNALVALDLLPPRGAGGLALDVLEEPPRAHLRWAVLGSERIDARGERADVAELAGLGALEFQPGPVLAGELVVVQARDYSGQVRAWCLAFDRRDGRLVWRRALAAGADRLPSERLAPSTRRVAGQPLLALERDGAPYVFAGTHLGLGALLSAADGEVLWWFENRRREARAAGWTGERPPLAIDADGDAGGVPTILWAPMDSDRVYSLRAGPLGPADEELGGLWVRPPGPLAGAGALVGGDAEELVVQGSAGAERMLSARRAGLDRRDALALGPHEQFRGRGLLSATRAWTATTRALYLFDRTRELYLLDVVPLPPPGQDPPGGDLYARGDHVLVLGSGALWSLRAR